MMMRNDRGERVSEREYYGHAMRQVQLDYERALSIPRGFLIDLFRYTYPTYILHADGMIEVANNFSPETQAAIDHVGELTTYVHESFREPMRKAVENYNRAVERERDEP